MEDFFIILHNILAEMEEVTDLQPVPDAHVPVMRFKFQGISIDLLYASISLLVVPEVSFSSLFKVLLVLFYVFRIYFCCFYVSSCYIIGVHHMGFQTIVCYMLLLSQLLCSV